MADRSWVNRAATAIELTLVAVGVACFAGYGYLSHRSGQIEAGNRRAAAQILKLDDDRAPEAAAPKPGTPEDDRAPSINSDVIGELEIPRLDLSAAVVSGDDRNALAGAVGYLQDTALPWQHGNTALAAHRDRLFRPLARIQSGDEIRLSTRHGRFEYRVVRTFVVAPQDLWVLDDSPGVDLTLITCYPFVFVGHAPQRFIVRARKVAMQ